MAPDLKAIHPLYNEGSIHFQRHYKVDKKLIILTASYQIFMILKLRGLRMS